MHTLTVRLEGQRLTPISTVVFEGATYTTYETSPTSPLYFFHVRSQNSGGRPRFALEDGKAQPLVARTTSGGQLIAEPYVGVVARAGMINTPPTVLGKYVLEYPMLGMRAESALSVSVTMPVESCAMRDVPVALPDVDAQDLAAAGSHAHLTAFKVRMDCTSAGIPLTLTLTDATLPGNTGSTLAPTADSTAQGVRIELLRGGSPVVLQQAWRHGTSSVGAQEISLQARYARQGAALLGGTLAGQAVLTLDYR